MIKLLISFIFGIIQMLLLGRLVPAITSGKVGIAALYMFVKLILYAAGIAAAVLLYFDDIMWIAAGFIAGFPISTMVVFGFKTFCSRESAERNVK